MTHYRSPQEIRRFDLMKLGVLLLLIVLLILTWILTRDGGPLDLAGEPEATAVAEATAADGLTREPGTVVAPTLAAPAIAAPSGALAPEGLTLSGVAGPGARVQVLADGQPLGQTSAGVDGAWSLTAALPAGQHTLVARTLDNVGSVVAESAPLTITVGPAPTAGASADGSGQWTVATFNTLTDTWTLGGIAAPNAAVVVLSGGAPLGQTTADNSGNWSLDAPAAAVADTIVVQTSDAGAVAAAPVAIGARPPSITAPGNFASASDGSSFFVVPGDIVLWTGRGTPGTQVEAILDGQSAGVATVDANAVWQLQLNVPPGQHTIRFDSRDAAGQLLVSGEAWAVAGGAEAAAEMAGGPLPNATVEPTTVAETTPATETTPAETTPAAEATPSAETTPATDPPADTALAALQSRPELSTLLAAAETAGLAEALAGPGALTVFAPTNDAFAALPQSAVDALLANPEALAALLRYHVARGRYTAADLRIVQPATLDGRLLTVTSQGDSIAINGATVLAADVAAGSGLVHVVDRILLPPLATGVRPPVIDESGVSTFVGPDLTVVGTGQPGRTIRVESNGEAFGEAAVVDVNGNWQVSGVVAPGEYRFVAFMLNGVTLEAFSRPVALTAR